jgi:hypothetical protein
LEEKKDTSIKKFAGSEGDAIAYRGYAGFIASAVPRASPIVSFSRIAFSIISLADASYHSPIMMSSTTSKHRCRKKY